MIEFATMMKWLLYLRFFLAFQYGLGYFDSGTGVMCVPGSEWSTGECGQKCRCLARGITHCAPNPCVVVKHEGNGEVKVKEMLRSASAKIFFGRDITHLVDRRVLFPENKALHKRFTNMQEKIFDRS